MSTPTIPLASLRFDGERFDDNALDVDCVGELSAYKRLVMDSVVAATTAEPTYVEGVKPIWETLAELGASVPAEVWEQVPTDLAKRLDHYLYSSNVAK